MRQWRHLKSVKRGGGAHQAHPLSATTPGSFAIECPTCPHPGRNLPDDWDSVCGAKEYGTSFDSSQILLTCSQGGSTHSSLLLMLTSSSNRRTVKLRIRSSDPGGLISLKILHTHVTLRTTPTKRMYVHTKYQRICFDAVSRLPAVVASSTQSIKQIRVAAKITSPAV